MGALGIPGGVFARAAPIADDFGVDAVQLLTGRAVLHGWAPCGRVSAGAATRLLPSADDWFALTLSRADDLDAVPALLQADADTADPWPAIAEWAAERSAEQVVGRARLLGLPAARLGEAPGAAPGIRAVGTSAAPRSPAGLLVVDLTSMWAGPLCAQLLARAGAVVVKVESPTRPDGTRADAAFFDWVNTGKLNYAVDFDRSREQLAALLAAADVVLEASRPVALTRRGLGPHDIAGHPGRVWLRITGHGSAGVRGDWVAFGDDAAVAGGLVGTDGTAPVFVGDAIADPLTGLHAAAEVCASLSRGGGELIDIALAQVAAGYADCPDTPAAPASTPPPANPPAAALGADNTSVEALVAQRNRGSC